MAEFFNRRFDHLDPEHLQDLSTLEMEGAIYNYFSQVDDPGFVYARVRLNPTEIVSYIDAATAYNEFAELYKATGDPTLALRKLTNAKIRKAVEEYNEWIVEAGQEDTAFCFAALWTEPFN